MQTGSPAPDQGQNSSTGGRRGLPVRTVDRGEFVARLAAQQNVSVPTAAAAVRVAEALRTTADEHPELTDAEAIEALRSIEHGVRVDGVPRRQR